MEIAPENWIHVGGALGKETALVSPSATRSSFTACRSQSAPPRPLNEQLVRDIKDFMAEHNIRMYSEHLSYCGDDGQLV